MKPPLRNLTTLTIYILLTTWTVASAPPPPISPLSTIPLEPPPFRLTDHSSQVILGITKSWNSTEISLQMYEHKRKKWKKSSPVWMGRIGQEGAAWGLGLHPHQKGRHKKEGDKRAPSGIFRLGGIWGYAQTCERHPLVPYRQITTRDLWVDDSSSLLYNQHFILDHEPNKKWEKKAQMRQSDYAHSLKLFIGHNSPPQTLPEKGSAIFFHIWRKNGKQATAGCTTMSETNLRAMIKSLKPSQSPTYILLPESEYKKWKLIWNLP